MRISDWSSDVCSSDLPALAGEGRGDDLHAEMRLAPLAVAGMTLVLFRIINDLKALRRQGLGQLMLHGLGNGHSPRSEERRVGKECVSTCRSRWSPYH